MLGFSFPLATCFARKKISDKHYLDNIREFTLKTIVRSNLAP